MFRNFYAEQDMADPRDSWYKPNLLYNIHYRPQKLPTPPKMMVLTKEFNPSVCTCGEHGCVPHYRMEREVIWSHQKVRKEEDMSLMGILQDDRDVKAQMESEIDEGADSSEDDDEDDADDAHGEDGKEWKCVESDEDRVDYIKSMSIGMNATEVGSPPSTCLSRFDDLTEVDKPEPDVLSTTNNTSVTLVENEEFGSAFGIMSVYCDSELHTWNWKNEIRCH